MTVFHGVPLIKRWKGLRLNGSFWRYTPCIPAARREKCGSVLSTDDSDGKESPGRETAASLLIGSLLCIAGIPVGAVTRNPGRMEMQAPIFDEFMVVIMPFAMLLWSGLCQACVEDCQVRNDWYAGTTDTAVYSVLADS
jgi:hypothetical protein